MLLNEFWVRILEKLMVDVSLNGNLVIQSLLAEQTRKERVVAVTVARQSTVTDFLELHVLREHEQDKDRKQNTETRHVFHESHVKWNSVFEN